MDSSVVPFQAVCRELERNEALGACIGVTADMNVEEALRSIRRRSGIASNLDADPTSPLTFTELAAYYKPLRLQRLLPPGVSANPFEIIKELVRELRGVALSGTFSSRDRLSFLGLVNKLQECIAPAERIVQQSVPAHYSHYTSRFLSLWCLALPLGLAQSLGFLVMPMMGLIVWALFGLREIGVMIENPFRRSFRFDLISQTIARDVARSVLAE